MKKVLLLVVLLLALTVTAVYGKPTRPGCKVAYRDVVLGTQPASIILYHELNGNLTDSGPLALTGAASSGIIYAKGIDKTRGASLASTGTSYIDLGSNFRSAYNAANMSNVSIVFWVKQLSIDTTTNYIFSLLGSDPIQITAFISGSNNLRISLIGLGYGNREYSQPLNDNAWHMVAITSNATTTSVYFDNIALTPYVSSGSFDANISLSFSKIGAGFSDGSFHGYVDELTIWNAVLTPAEISKIYNAGVPKFSAFLPVVGTNAVVQIFDRTGVPIGEILPEIDSASWRRNEIGQVTFSMAKSDPKSNDVYLRAQNRILITFDNGLPPWGGIIQPEFAIDHNRIQARALTGESLLTRRLTDRGRYFTQTTVGGIVTALITEANAVWPLGIDLGVVWGGGDGHSPEYHYKDMLSIFKESLFKRLSDADFYAEPVVADNGRLTFILQVAERRGRDLAGVALHQGLNVVDPTKVSFVGPIINSWTIVGDGQGWGSERPLAVAQDLESIDRYGLLEGSEIHQGTVFLETLQATADNLLAQTAWPRVLLDVTAVDLPPATFEQYGIGDNLAVELPDYGIGSSFVGAATVMARAFYPKNGRLNLVLEATSYA